MLLRDRLGDPVGFMILMRDIREIKRLERLSETDHLTGLFNRQKMEALIDAEIRRYRRSGERFSLILFDLDDFKKVNDELGHDTGDAVLVDVARVARSSLRSTDTLARWGGEEFLILCPGSAAEGALLLAERLRRAIRSGVSRGRGSGPMTASFGIATVADEDSLEFLVKRADSAMYESKRRGKDQSTNL
jgi:diguanylate cyclase (GGDEF)-like protein